MKRSAVEIEQALVRPLHPQCWKAKRDPSYYQLRLQVAEFQRDYMHRISKKYSERGQEDPGIEMVVDCNSVVVTAEAVATVAVVVSVFEFGATFSPVL